MCSKFWKRQRQILNGKRQILDLQDLNRWQELTGVPWICSSKAAVAACFRANQEHLHQPRSDTDVSWNGTSQEWNGIGIGNGNEEKIVLGLNLERTLYFFRPPSRTMYDQTEFLFSEQYLLSVGGCRIY